MSSRRDPTSKRLHELFKISPLINSKRVFEATVAPPGAGFDTVFRLEDDLVYLTFARSALHLDKDNSESAAMLRAFEAAGLDHRNPNDWRQLLSMFAEAHFGETKTKPISWDTFALLGVLQDYTEVKKSHPPKVSDSEICKILQKDRRYKTKYGKYNFDALRKLVRQAQSPEHNFLLRNPEMRDPVLQMIRERFEARGMTWDAQLEPHAKLIAETLFDLLEIKVEKS